MNDIKQTTSIRLTPEMKARVKARANEQGRSVTMYIFQLIKEDLKNN